MSLPFESFLDLDDNDAGSKLPDEYSEFFPVLTVELVGTLFLYLAFLFIHSPESKLLFTGLWVVIYFFNFYHLMFHYMGIKGLLLLIV